MIINGIFIKGTMEILYSRERHDLRESEDGKFFIDGGFDYIRIGGDINGFIEVKIDSDCLLNLILGMDYRFGNSNAENFPNGYHGRFKITEKSNINFFRDLIVNFDDIEEYFVGFCEENGSR